jgi:hypothetical protein
VEEWGWGGAYVELGTAGRARAVEGDHLGAEEVLAVLKAGRDVTVVGQQVVNPEGQNGTCM